MGAFTLSVRERRFGVEEGKLRGEVYNREDEIKSALDLFVGFILA